MNNLVEVEPDSEIGRFMNKYWVVIPGLYKLRPDEAMIRSRHYDLDSALKGARKQAKHMHKVLSLPTIVLVVKVEKIILDERTFRVWSDVIRYIKGNYGGEPDA